MKTRHSEASMQLHQMEISLEDSLHKCNHSASVIEELQIALKKANTESQQKISLLNEEISRIQHLGLEVRVVYSFLQSVSVRAWKVLPVNFVSSCDCSKLYQILWRCSRYLGRCGSSHGNCTRDLGRSIDDPDTGIRKERSSITSSYRQPFAGETLREFETQNNLKTSQISFLTTDLARKVDPLSSAVIIFNRRKRSKIFDMLSLNPNE